MSTLGGTYKNHKFHGAPERFEVLAEYTFEKYERSVKYIADIAGGRGMLTRILNKKYGYEAEVVDPRGWALKGVPNLAEEFTQKLAGYYDLIVGLHPDEATRAVAEGALIKPAILIPCCNFWDQSKKLGREALLEAIAKFYEQHGVTYARVEFDFASSKNIGLVSRPLHAKP